LIKFVSPGDGRVTLAESIKRKSWRSFLRQHGMIAHGPGSPQEYALYAFLGLLANELQEAVLMVFRLSMDRSRIIGRNS
jgi:hypothetical protein